MLGARHRPHWGAGTASNNADAAPSRQPFVTASVRANRSVGGGGQAPPPPRLALYPAQRPSRP
jgi:hypothetical protein